MKRPGPPRRKQVSRTDPTEPPRPYHHGDLRRALVQAACAIIEEHGIAGLTLRAVGQRAAVSHSAAYHHFAGKTELLTAVAVEGFDRLTGACQSAAAKVREPDARLSETGVAYVEFATRNPGLFGLMFAQTRVGIAGDSLVRSAAGRAYGVLLDATAEALAAHSRPASALPISALLAWATAHGLAKILVETQVRPADYGEPDAKMLARTLLTRLVDRFSL